MRLIYEKVEGIFLKTYGFVNRYDNFNSHYIVGKSLGYFFEELNINHEW